MATTKPVGTFIKTDLTKDGCLPISAEDRRMKAVFDKSAARQPWMRNQKKQGSKSQQESGLNLTCPFNCIRILHLFAFLF